MDKKNTMLLTVIAVATLLVAVVGATFAYFTASNTASGSTTATVKTEAVGAVTVANAESALYLNLVASQMAQNTAGTSYWATTVEADKFSATQVDAVIARMEANGGVGTTVYDCGFDLNVAKNSDIKANDASVVFTLAEGVKMDGITSGTPVDYAGLATSYRVTFTQTGPTEAAEDLVKVAIQLHNTNDEAGQDHIAGKTLTTTFTNDNMSCIVK